MAVNILGSGTTPVAGSRDLTSVSEIDYTFSTGLVNTDGTITTDDSAIDHDALDNFEANEHIDHTSISLTISGTANEVEVSGGAQTIAANRTWTIGLPTSIKVDTITESTPDAGVTIESVALENGGITLASGATVNNIQTTITNSDTVIPTSGAVIDYVATELSAATNSGKLVARGVLEYTDDGGSDVSIVTLGADDIVWSVKLYVEEAFNDTGANQLFVGYTGNSVYYLTANTTLLTSTGWKTITWNNDPSANAQNPLSGSREFVWSFNGGNSDSDAGKAYLYIEYSQF